MDKTDFLKDEDQFIIVANHNSHLDTMSIMASLPSSIVHKVKPVAAKDHFGKTRLSTFLSEKLINSLLIERKRDKENPSNDPICQMIAELDKGNSLIIFPEGTRGKPEVEEPLKAGIAIILQQRPNIKFVPAYMQGMGLAMPKGDSLIIPHSSRLEYGKAQLAKSTQIDAILNQIQENFDQLKQKMEIGESQESFFWVSKPY
jgi:1-acyl-sn-glycerol-3-phosphate acyltransferase